VTGRYEPARDRLDEAGRPNVGSRRVAALRVELERRGRVRDVKAEAEAIEGDGAVAQMKVVAAGGSVTAVRVNLVRRHGLWFVSEVPTP
jgi:hypothetical protein